MQMLSQGKAGWPGVTPKTLVFICYLLAFVLSVVTPAWTYAVEKATAPPANPLQDDFSSDSGLWEYSGTAYRDPEKSYVVLTAPEDYKQGTIWLKHEVNTFFTAEFKYLAGGGTGADGISFMFYKQKPPSPVHGGSLGFNTRYNVASGYGIEFDNYKNYIIDPCERHIALIKDSIANHLAWGDDLRTEDNAWHQVVARTHEQGVTVTVDGQTVLDWRGTLAKNFGGLALSAGTGKYNNWQLIDDFKLTIPEAPAEPHDGEEDQDDDDDDEEPDRYFKLVSYRGMDDTIPGPMYYGKAEEGKTDQGRLGLYPTGFWAPGDTHERVLVVKNVGTVDAKPQTIRAILEGRRELAEKLQVRITAADGTELVPPGTLSQFAAREQALYNPLWVKKGEKVELHFKVTLPLDAGNEYQNLSLKTGFRIYAED